MPRPLPHLRRRADFLRVAAFNRRAVTDGLILQAAPSPEAGDVASSTIENRRVGFTATRRIGGAVVRNRAKRRLRAAAMAILPVHAATGHDYVLIARAGTVGRPWHQLLGDLDRALRRLALRRDAS